MAITKKRIKFYLKKFRWILIIAILLGLLTSIYDINKNRNRESNFTYKQEIILVSSRNTTEFIDNFNLILNSDEFRAEFNKNNDKASYSITTGDVKGSGFIITTTSMDKKSAESAILYIENNGFERYKNSYPDVEIVKNNADPSLINSKTPAVQMKDILLLIGPLFLALLFMYIKMLFDDRLYSNSEVENYLGIFSTEIAEKDIKRIFERKEELDNITVVIGRGIEYADSSITSLSLSEYNNGIYDKDSLLVIIKEKEVTTDELLKLKNRIKFSDLKDIRIFVIHE